MVQTAIDDYGDQWVMDATNRAVKANKYRWDYIEGILRNWRKNGRDERPKSREPERLGGRPLPDGI
jgi:hypothetical protein